MHRAENTISNSIQSAKTFAIPRLPASFLTVAFFVTFLLIYFGSVPNHLPQFPFLRKFAAQDAKVVDQIFAGLHESSARSKCTVSLNAENKLAMGMADVSEDPPKADRLDLLTYLTSGWGTL